MKERVRLAVNFMLQSLRKQWKGVVAYGLFSVGALVLFLYLTLPWALLENRILYELSKATSLDIKARESHYLFPSGIRISGLLFSNPASAPGPSDGKNPTVKPIGKIEEIALQVRMTDLLWGTVRSSFTANAFGGQISGTFGNQAKKQNLDTEWKKIDLASVKNVTNLQVGLSGSLQGKGHLVLGPEGPSGDVRLTIDHGKIKDLKLMGFTLPEIAFDEVRGSGEIKNRALILKEVKLRGDDVKGSVKGEITLADNKAPAVLNLQFHLHLSDQARAPYQGVLSLVERNRDKEGYYNFSITGTTKEPRVSQ